MKIPRLLSIALFFLIAAILVTANTNDARNYLKSWVPSSRCLKNLYSEEELDRAQATFLVYSGEHRFRCQNASFALQQPDCSRVIHSCDSEEMTRFNLTQVRALEWYEIARQQVDVVELWKKLYQHQLRNTSLTFIGDSLSMEVYTAMMLTLLRGGANCRGKTCENGFTSYRPYIRHISENYEQLLASSDIVVINSGLHYNDVLVYEKEMKEGIPRLVELIDKYNKTVLWMDSFVPHFPVSDGSYVKYKMLNRSEPTCTALTEKNDWRNSIADKYLDPYSHKIGRVRIRDIASSRHDTHNGILTHFTASNLDCVHHCMQPCFWEAILFRLANALTIALS